LDIEREVFVMTMPFNHCRTCTAEANPWAALPEPASFTPPANAAFALETAGAGAGGAVTGAIVSTEWIHGGISACMCGLDIIDHIRAIFF
jgi:hypothetical protein